MSPPKLEFGSPEPTCKLAMVLCLCNPSAMGYGDNRVPGAPWPGCPAG